MSAWIVDVGDKMCHGQRPPRSPALCCRVDRLDRGCELSQNTSHHWIRIRERVVIAEAQRDLMRSGLLEPGDGDQGGDEVLEAG